MCTPYLDATFISHAWHQDLPDHFRYLQVSMIDGNVNWAFFSYLCNYRTENNTSKLFSTGSWGLPAIHGAFKTGGQSTDWKPKKVLKALLQVLHHSPVRQSCYADVTGSSRFALPFCGIRWIEYDWVAVRAIEIWDGMLCTFWLSLLKSNRPASENPLILAKLHFFSYITGIMKPFLTEYQYTKLMMPFMYDDFHQLLIDVMSKYIKPERLEKCKNASILCDVNFSDTKNQLKNKKVDIGFGANKILTDNDNWLWNYHTWN